MPDDYLQDRIDRFEREVVGHKPAGTGRRNRSATCLCGLPLYDIALGPDPSRGEIRGHARGILAIGDVATGVIALGGIARGVVAFGGLAFGAITFGGCSIGIVLATGGLAAGAVAVGGAAFGFVAAGGLAVGYYACGGGAFGQHVLSALQQDPEAVRFFRRWIHWIPW